MPQPVQNAISIEIFQTKLGIGKCYGWAFPVLPWLSKKRMDNSVICSSFGLILAALGLTHTYPGVEQQTDFITIFLPFSIPHAGRTARKKNINQRARLLQMIQTILFHVDIWYNATFQFSGSFLRRFVTWPTPGHSCAPFGVDRGCLGPGKVLSTLLTSKLGTAHLA